MVALLMRNIEVLDFVIYYFASVRFVNYQFLGIQTSRNQIKYRVHFLDTLLDFDASVGVALDCVDRIMC